MSRIPESLAQHEDAIRVGIEEAQVALGGTWSAGLVRWKTETDSTMLDARGLFASLPAGSWAVCGADLQSGGRGRQGRRWSSPPGGLYFTVAAPIPRGPESVNGLSLVVGAAIARALDPQSELIALKWPNDLLTWDGRKLGGILIEVVPSGHSWWALIGIGLNVDEPPYDVEAAASLHDIGVERARRDIAVSVVSNVLAAHRDVCSGGFDPNLIEWDSRDFLRQRQVSVETGRRDVSGVASGVDATGALLIDIDGVVEPVHSGHISSIGPVRIQD